MAMGWREVNGCKSSLEVITEETRLDGAEEHSERVFNCLGSNPASAAYRESDLILLHRSFPFYRVGTVIVLPHGIIMKDKQVNSKSTSKSSWHMVKCPINIGYY